MRLIWLAMLSLAIPASANAQGVEKSNMELVGSDALQGRSASL